MEKREDGESLCSGNRKEKKDKEREKKKVKSVKEKKKGRKRMPEKRVKGL